MARAIRWQIPFVSLSEIHYTINIYAEGWTGSITTLTPATEPFVVEENNDYSLLEVIRSKTGYISFIRYDSTDIDSIQPSTLTDRYIELKRDSTVVFRGYLQPQSFDSKLNYASTGNPGEPISIAFVSALGIIDDIMFDKITTPQSMTLMGVLTLALAKMNGNEGGYFYQKVIFPSGNGYDNILLNTYISSLIISPLSDSNIHGIDLTLAECFEQKSIGYFLNGLAHAFGCMVHEVADTLVFSRFDWKGTNANYQQYTVGSTSTTTINNPGDVTLAPSCLIEGENNMQTIRPLREMRINYEGDTDVNYKMNFQHCKRVSGYDSYQYFGLAVNRPVLTDEVNIPYIRESCSISATNGRPIYTGGYAIAYGSGSLQEMALFCFNAENSGHSYATGDTLLEYGFFGYIGRQATLSIEAKWGDTIKLECPDLGSFNFAIFHIRVSANGKYLNSNGEWQNTATNCASVSLNTLKDKNNLYSLTIPTLNDSGILLPLKVTIIKGEGLGSGQSHYVFAITSINLSYSPTSNVTDYIYEGSFSNTEILKGDGQEEDDIDVNFSPYTTNSHSLYPTTIYSKPEYRYMFKRQRVLTICYPGAMPLSSEALLYLQMSVFKSIKCRITEIKYDPWNEKTTVTLHASETLQN